MKLGMNSYNHEMDPIMNNAERVLLGKQLIVRITKCCPSSREHEEYAGELWYLVKSKANGTWDDTWSEYNYLCTSHEVDSIPSPKRYVFLEIEILP